MQLEDSVIVVVASRGFLLELELKFVGWFRGKGHVVGLVEPDNCGETTHSLVQGFISEPLPFAPSICDSGVISSSVVQVDWPHDSGLEVVSFALVLNHSEVIAACAHMGVHG